MTGVLGAIGVGLAVPGVIDVLVRGGEVVYDKIDAFRKVDRTLTNFRELMLDLKEGTLFFGLQSVKAASNDRSLPEAIKQQLDRSLNDLNKELSLTNHILDAVHEDTIKGKLTYTFWRGKGSKHQIDEQYQSLKTSCDKLKDLCLQLHTYHTAESSYLLTSDVFKLRHETSDDQPGELLPDSDILVAVGNYNKRGHRIAADFILEKKSRENNIRYLCSKLGHEALKDAHGVLPALGYRQPPYNNPDGSKFFQLIFELPQDTLQESLAHWICTKSVPELTERLKLCLDLAKAVKSIHALDLVHKAVRPRAVLLLTPTQSANQWPTMALQDWTYVRELEGATTELGETSWQRRIYQHPERQGKYADVVYEPKHDIYSLGVCMLEILLWKPFIVKGIVAAGITTQPEYAICEMFESYGLNRGEENGGLTLRYRGDTSKLTSKSWVTKTIWSDIVSSEINDPELSQLVLRCLDGGFQSASEVVEAIDSVLERHQGP